MVDCRNAHGKETPLHDTCVIRHNYLYLRQPLTRGKQILGKV
jgi:hypothetical protein